MTEWWKGVLPVLDFETTGLDTKICRPVQVAMVFVTPNNTLTPESLITLINPGCEIPEEASRLHDITTERVKDEPSAREVMRQVWDRLSLVHAKGLPLVIFNAPFDWSLLKWEMNRHFPEHMDSLVVWLSQIPIVDPRVIDLHLDRFRKGSRRLESMCIHYKLSNEVVFHDAEQDAVMTARLLRQLTSKYSEIKIDLAELHDAQVSMFESWKLHINQWWRLNGIPQEVTETWPGW